LIHTFIFALNRSMTFSYDDSMRITVWPETAI
jgi:hypothetical protein